MAVSNLSTAAGDLMVVGLHIAPELGQEPENPLQETPAMKTNGKSLALLGGLAVGCFAVGNTPARAQGLSFGYSGPGVSVGVTTGGGFYGGGFYGGGYPVVTPGPVVVAPYPQVVVQRPLYVARPFFGPRPFYGPRVYGGYRPYPYYYRR
jgi:hypothetical protein